MGVIIKESIKSSIFSYIGVIIGYVNVLWLYPYFLAADQIGLFRIIQSSAYLLATFGQFGMGSTLVKFYPKLKLEKGFIGLVLAVASFWVHSYPVDLFTISNANHKLFCQRVLLVH
jgi:hypothetical protein